MRVGHEYRIGRQVRWEVVAEPHAAREGIDQDRRPTWRVEAEAGVGDVLDLHAAVLRSSGECRREQPDRGEDEDGIQIVIPNFYAGDEHAIVLDVVASGPGPIADVTVRYKDLAFLRNGVARSRLALERQEKIAGPLEYNVLKNFLAQRLSDVLDEAGVALARGNAGETIRLLTERRDLLTGLRRELPGLQNGDLAGDIAMLNEYTTLLGRQAVEQPGPRNYLSDSLRYAARLKVQPQPPMN